jgi:hypothetical protein
MPKTSCIAVVLLISLFVPVFAGGANEDEGYEPVAGLDNWSHEFDLSSLKEGKYNLIIKGQDKAGNIYYEGPINLYVDPESDLPVATISNPRPESRVGGNLYAVGTCVDDDAVAKVELRLDDGEWVTAEGTDYWSYLFNVDSIPDGRHVITVRGTDVNGLVGNETSVVFNLDTTKPLNRVTSHESGVLVSGKLRLEGSVRDANGVKLLEYSTDGGTTYQPLKLSYDKKEDLYAFSFSVETTKLEDGPYVYWFRSRDNTNSIGYSAFLFFVDNTKPTLEIYTPLPDEPVNGVVTVAGKVFDEIGVKRLSYNAGEGLSGEIPLVPGNPYWVLNLDLSAVTKKTHQVVFTMEDTIGNVSQYRHTVTIDTEADLPVVTLAAPVPNSEVRGEFRVTGFVSDDDGGKSVVLSLDGREALTLTTCEAFDTVLEGVTPGKHTLSVYAIDVNGTRGRDVSVNVVRIDAPPSVSLATLSGAGGPEPFRAGIEVSPLVKNTLSGAVLSVNALASVEAAFGGLPAVKLSHKKDAADGRYLFDAPVPDGVPFGIVPVRITATDVFGQIGTVESFIHVTNLSKPRGEPEVIFIDSRIEPDGTVRLAPGRQLSGVFVAEPIRSVRLVPESNLVRVSVRGERILVEPVSRGVGVPVKVEVTTEKGHVFASREFRFITDIEPPTVTLTSPAAGAWVKNSVTIEGKVTDGTGTAKLEYSLDRGERYTAAAFSSGQDGDGSFRIEVPLGAMEDGSVPIELRATDVAGNVRTVRTLVRKDTKEPLGTIMIPEYGTALRGRLSLYGLTVDQGSVEKVELTFDGSRYITLEGRDEFFYDGDVPSNAVAGRFSIRITDRSGNVFILFPEFTVEPGRSAAVSSAGASTDGAADKEKPVIQVLSHKTNDRVHGRVAVAGLVTDNAGVKSLSCTYAGVTEEIPLAAGSPYWIKVVDFTGQGGKRVTLSFAAEDLSGNKTTYSLQLSADDTTDEPAVSIEFPKPDTVVSGPLYAWGTVTDDDGIASISYSVDGGAAVTQRSGEGFVIDLSALAPGTHTLSVTATDNAGREGKPASVKFTLSGDAPAVSAASVVTGKDAPVEFYPGMRIVCDAGRTLEGTLRAANPPQSLEYSLAWAGSLEGQKRPLQYRKGADAGTYLWSLALPKDLPYELVRITLYAADSHGKTGEYRSFFYNVKADAGPVRDGEEIVFPSGTTDSRNFVRLAIGSELQGYYNGRKIESVSVEPSEGLVSVRADRNFIAVTALRGGISSPATIKVVTIDKDLYEWGPVVFTTDTTAPSLALETPGTGSWHGAELLLSGMAVERETELVSLSYSLNGGASVSIPLENIDVSAGGRFELTAPLQTVPDGNVTLTVRAEDRAGNVTSCTAAFKKDTVAPALTLLAPPAGEPFNGLTTLVGKVTDAGRVTGVLYTADGETSAPVNGIGVFSHDVDFSLFDEVPDTLAFSAIDKSGNTGVLRPDLSPDLASDVPVVQLQTPADGEVIRNDFIISGMVFDDDGVSAIYYRMDDGEFVSLPAGSSFSIPVALSEVTDNEHWIEVKAVDPGGVESEVARSMFKVSLAEPVSQVIAPELDDTVRGKVMISGTAEDKNGIADVFLSLDNGNTFYRAEGTESWSFSFNSELLKDGIYSVMVKAVDSYGTEGLHSTLVTIDNTAPELMLDYPSDGAIATETLRLEGRVKDNVRLARVQVRLYELNKAPDEADGASASGVIAADPEAAAHGGTDDKTAAINLTFDGTAYPLPLTELFSERIDITGLKPGWYNVRVEAFDAADNRTYLARNLFVQAKERLDRLEILYPAGRARVSGYFTLEGAVTSSEPVSFVSLVREGGPTESVPVDENGCIRYEFGPDTLTDGTHTFRLRLTKSDATVLESEPLTVEYSRTGAWVKIDSHGAGSYVTGRPFLSGTAGYFIDPADKTDKAAWAAYTDTLKAHRLTGVEVSLDNGRTFGPAKGLENWQFRLETQDYPDGRLLVLVRAQYADGSSAVVSSYLIVDDVPPEIRLLNLEENGKFNQSLAITGTAADESGLSILSANLRQGDKAAYEVPEFIQGLYFDFHTLGITYWDIGAGLTFFDDNVKLQAQIGQAPLTGRFRGLVLGAKLLANIARVPFQYFFGPDWEWLSASVAVGANFSYLTMSENTIAFTEEGLVLASVVAQLEFPIVKFRSMRMFNTYSFFSEFQFWFISSDVEAGFKPKMSFGVRVNVF